MPTQLTIRKALKEARLKLDDVRAMLEEIVSDISMTEFDNPDIEELHDDMCRDIEVWLGALETHDQDMISYTG